MNPTIKSLFLLLLLAVAVSMSSCLNKVGRRGVAALREAAADYQESSEDAQVEGEEADQEDDQAGSASSDESEDGNDGARVAASEVEIPVLNREVPSLVLKRYAYTVSYNKSTRCANWVAWKLTGRHTYGPHKREDYDFHEDMEVPSPRATSEDYSHNGMGLERGHLCPAGDNKWSGRAMDECHLLSNICPQYGKLNGGAWKYLEEDCREWAEAYDSIYIVCGPLFTGKTRRTIGEDHVAVPDGFFKVILRLGKNPQALGFVYPNRKCPGGKGKYVMSVDEVERIAGMDFFSALDDKVEAKVERASNLSLWR